MIEAGGNGDLYSGTGNDLDLQKRCVKINGKANTLLLKLKSEIFPPKKVTIDETDADADVGMDADSGKLVDCTVIFEPLFLFISRF